MSLKNAMNIVLDLAEQNVIDERDAMLSGLIEEREDQLWAIERVRKMADEMPEMCE